MNYRSTRSTAEETVLSAVAIKNGLAPDGGLYMPTEIPSITTEELTKLIDCSYPERAAYVMGKYLSDYTADELLTDCKEAYAETRFPGGAAPIHTEGDGISVLELWHGPTCAFKDMALQIMPRLLSRALQKTGEKRTAMILVATSGDTGKAALEGYRDVNGIKIQVYYPLDGVSRVQKLQMATQEGDNVDVCAIHGNFDDAQSGVKKIFSDEAFRAELNEKNVFLSSANSINWGRLVPQIVYYISAYCDMVKRGAIALGETLDVCVPTGNFGNIFAGYLAKKMGLPLGRLLCASNQNHILTDFLQTGIYDRNRPFFTTISPSMDILISSNLERLLYCICGSEKTARYMKELSETGKYQLAEEELKAIQETFCGYYCDEEETKSTIRTVFESKNYLMDTHTAVAYGSALKYKNAAKADVPMLVVSTASPYKFACDVYEAILAKKAEDELAALEMLSAYTKVAIPAPLCGIGERTVRFSRHFDPAEMKKNVLRFATEAM